MKKIFIMAVLTLVSGQAWAIDFWHSGTVWANQGMCAATFSFDAGPMSETIRQLKATVTIRDKSGKSIGSDNLEIEEFGGSEAARYSSASLVSENICADGLTITVTKASAVIDGKKVDLLKTKQLVVRDFKPFKIKVGK